jgi:hypothetical protein
LSQPIDKQAIDTEDQQLLDIFMEYALAMHDAQLLEARIASVNTIWGDEMRSLVITGDELIADIEAQGGSTLGRLVQGFKKRVRGATLYPQLERALQLRNHLAHRFFRDAFGKMDDPSVRRDMLSRLTEARKTFGELDDTLNMSMERWLQTTESMRSGE